MAKYIILENSSNLNENQHHDTAITASELNDPEIPTKIWQMMQLYEYGDGSFEQQKKNFLRQGEFMKDFEDDYDGWSGKCTYFSPAYHDLTLKMHILFTGLPRSYTDTAEKIFHVENFGEKRQLSAYRISFRIPLSQRAAVRDRR